MTKLRIEELQVESFSTSAQLARRGTVVAHDTYFNCSYAQCSVRTGHTCDTCPGETNCGTCVGAYTCDLQEGCSGNSQDMQMC
jgi:hypothetical protein